MSAPESNFRSWLAKAASDWLNIQNNLVAPRIPWDTICFHSQQVVEKTLKGFLLFHGKAAPRTHDLVALLAQCAQVDPALAALEVDCRRLTYYAVGSRYPDDLYEPQEQDAREMIAAAERVRAQLLSRLPVQESS